MKLYRLSSTSLPGLEQPLKNVRLPGQRKAEQPRLISLSFWERNHISAGHLAANTGPTETPQGPRSGELSCGRPGEGRAGRSERAAPAKAARRSALTAEKAQFGYTRNSWKITSRTLFAKDHSCCGGDLHICKPICRTYTEQSKKQDG